MVEWQNRDVMYFLLGATKRNVFLFENANLSKLSNVNGKKLIAMEPTHFEEFSPGDGQKIYEYVQQHYRERGKNI